jgi:hypothetical protein
MSRKELTLEGDVRRSPLAFSLVGLQKSVAQSKVLRLRLGADKKPTKANAAMHPVVVSEEVFCADEIQAAAFYADENVLVFNMEVCEALRLLAARLVFQTKTVPIG